MNLKIVNFVTSIENQYSGFSRYSKCLLDHLNNQKIQLNLVQPKTFFNHPFTINTKQKGLIHFSNQALIPFFGFAKTKTIVTVHDLILLKYPSLFTIGGLRISFFDKWKYNRTLKTLKKADAIIAVSKNTKKDIIQYLDYPEEKIHVIYEGVNKKFKPKIKKTAYNILYVGSECPHKNLEVLFRSFAQLKKMIPTVKLIKVGKAKWFGAREKLITLAKQLNIENDVIFKDYIENIEEEYQNADLFVFPSLYEGFGLPVLEAMACGCPVICSNTSSLPEVAGSAAVLINSTNIDELTLQMYKVLTNEKLRAGLIKKGLKQAKKFNWSKTAKETLEIYKKFI